jgi:TIR domain
MAAPPAAGIFVSYRRDDTAYPAGWLVDRLVGQFGTSRVFKDVDSIQLGNDFVADIMAAVGSCAVLLAVIGVRWLTATGEDGRRRLEDPSDFVRLEIEAALARNVRVIPVLVDGARMPRATDLPASMEGLARRQALELNPATFDTSRLLQMLEGTLAGTGPAAPDRTRNVATAGRTGTSDRGPSGKPSPPGRRRRIALVTGVVAVLAAAGIITAVLMSPEPSQSTGGPTLTPISTPSTSPATGFTVCVSPAVSCTNAMKTEPASIVVSADGGDYVKDLRWSGWGSETAVGSGTLERDNCDPSCANGTDISYAVTVTLSDLTPYGNGEQAYATMRLSAPGNSYNETFSQGLVP